MAKFYGIIGYVTSEETKPGVWEDVPVEHEYFGDVERNTDRWETNAEYLHDNLNINNRISIVADPYAYNHFHEMKYILWMGVYWKVNGVEVQYPRLILDIGGIYNGPTLGISSDTD